MLDKNIKWKRWEIKIKLLDPNDPTGNTPTKLIGGTPKDPNIIDRWIEAKAKKLTDKEKQKAKDNAVNSIEETEEKLKTQCGFMRNETGLVMEGRQIKAMLKENMDTLGVIKGKGSVKRKQILQHGLHVEEDKIPITRNDVQLIEPDGFIERPIHVPTPLGPRDALKHNQYVEGVTVTCTVRQEIPEDRETMVISEEMLIKALEAAQWSGLGADRSQGNGRFHAEIKAI